jgi:hypothetical protein
MQQCIQNGYDITMFQSIQELLLQAKRSRFITGDEEKEFECDYWGQQFRYVVIAKENTHNIVRIISDGPDGISQDGDDDDLYVECRWGPSAPPAMHLKGRGIE